MFEQRRRQKTINIAVTGAAGVGKSSFINAIRDRKADDADGAAVDIVESTSEITPYIHPVHNNLVFWDLPGVGTPNFPRATYFKAVNIKHYDFFLILSAGRFREDDLWLAKEVKKQRKEFYFVRTQVELDVYKDRRSHPKSYSKRKVFDKIRGNSEHNLAEGGFPNATIFLIDCYNTRFSHDFENLKTFLISKVIY